MGGALGVVGEVVAERADVQGQGQKDMVDGGLGRGYAALLA
jgi:hypothetical protein